MAVQAVRDGSAKVGAVGLPMAIHIGAEIRGVDLSRPLPPEHVSAVRNALLRWKVVFFRDQTLDHRSHIAAARHFGETTAGHVVYGSDGEYPQIYSVAKNRKANRFQGQVLSARGRAGTPTSPPRSIRLPLRSCAATSCRHTAATRSSPISSRPTTRCRRSCGPSSMD